MMQMNQVQQRITQIEQSADDALAATRTANAPNDLRQCVDEMHRKARQARDLCAQRSADEGQVVRTVDDLEQLGDRAMKACRQAGSSVDPKVQSAVQRAHDEISSLKKQLH
jgi:ABC-type transporter Mla subunit MlaD